MAQVAAEEIQFDKDPDLVYPESSFPMREEDVKLDLSDNPACQMLAPPEGSDRPVQYCEYVCEDFAEYKDRISKPFASEGGCELS